jgi:hypothetical protein
MISAASSTASLLAQSSLLVTSPYTESKDPYTGKITYTYNTPAPVTIDASTLSAYAASQTGGSLNNAAATAAKATPTPPWSSTSTAPQAAALVQAASNGAAFFDPTKSVLDAPAGANQKTYQGLFALYQGLNTLQGLANDASAKGVTAGQQAAYARTFAQGMTQLQTYIGTNPVPNVDLALGTITAQAQTTEGAKAETDGYTTQPLVTGSSSTPVPSLSAPSPMSSPISTANWLLRAPSPASAT